MRGQIKGQPLRFINGHNARVLSSVEQQRRAIGIYDRACKECGSTIPEGIASRVHFCSPECKAKAMLKDNKTRITYAKWHNQHVHRQIISMQSSNVVHHKDGNIANNAASNLEVLENQAAHIKEHLFEMRECNRIARQAKPKLMCIFDGCLGKYAAKGLCEKHYSQQWEKTRRRKPRHA